MFIPGLPEGVNYSSQVDFLSCSAQVCWNCPSQVIVPEGLPPRIFGSHLKLLNVGATFANEHHKYTCSKWAHLFPLISVFIERQGRANIDSRTHEVCLSVCLSVCLCYSSHRGSEQIFVNERTHKLDLVTYDDADSTQVAAEERLCLPPESLSSYTLYSKAWNEYANDISAKRCMKWSSPRTKFNQPQ